MTSGTFTEKNRRYRCEVSNASGLATIIIALHVVLLAYSGYVHSPTLNEPGHLVAGLSHWRCGHFELYRVNPPLVRVLAATPVLMAGCKDKWTSFDDRPGARPEFKIGADFIRTNGRRSFFLFTIARWACIPLSVLGAVICFAWARELYGARAGLLACALWCFSPSIIAHGSLITTDAHASAIGVSAGYAFWRWIRQSTWSRCVIAGIALGLVELAKTTFVVLYLFWPLIWILCQYAKKRNLKTSVHSCYQGFMLLTSLAISLYVLNFGYLFEGTMTRLQAFDFVSASLTGSADSSERGASASQLNANRFKNTLIGLLPVPLPRNYLLGIDIQQRDFEDYGRESYLNGVWSSTGWWNYYLIAFLIKTPTGCFAVASIALLSYAVPVVHRQKTSIAYETVLLCHPILILVAVSAQTGFSEHFRYALPILPFFFIWVSRSVLLLSLDATSPNKGTARYCVLCFLITWIVASSLWIYPHSLSYFNELIGGPQCGPRHLLGSNIDWGQDLRFLERFIKMNDTSISQIEYVGGFLPSHVGITQSGSDFGTIAVSVNRLYGNDEGLSATIRTARHYVKSTIPQPCLRFGYSMLLFSIDKDNIMTPGWRPIDPDLFP